LDDATLRQLLDRYRDAPRALSDAVSSLSASDLDRRVGEQWSARQVIHHIADAELIEGTRLRRIIAENNPMLPWVDEAEHARRLHYDRPIETSVQVFGAVVLANLSLAGRLEPGDWLRYGTHSLAGRYSVEDWLRKMSAHAHEHIGQLLRAAGREPS
jgi:hypothetical protein